MTIYNKTIEPQAHVAETTGSGKGGEIMTDNYDLQRAVISLALIAKPEVAQGLHESVPPEIFTDEYFRALHAGILAVGTCPETLAYFTGIDLDFIRDLAEEMPPISLKAAITDLMKATGMATTATSLPKPETHAPGDAWPEQEQPTADEVASKHFPLSPFPVDILPEYLQSLTKRYAAALQCQFAFMAMAFLTIASGAIGNSVRLAIKSSWKTAPFCGWVSSTRLVPENHTHLRRQWSR